MNREAEVAYGWSREELIGKPVNTLSLPERHPWLAHLRERCCAGEEIPQLGRPAESQVRTDNS